MNTLKKWALCLGLGMAAVSLPMPAAAAQDYEYTVLQDGTAAVTSADPSIVKAEIPARIDGYTVSTLADGCFDDHENLQTVVFPDTITTISDNAFKDCAALGSISIPGSVTDLGEFMFEGCTSLTEILVEDDNTAYDDEDGVLYTIDKTILIRYPAAKADVEYTVSEFCTTISPWAFTDCTKLQKLDLPAVTAIGADAFFCAQSLQTVNMSDGLTELVGATFAYCVNLRKITLPSTLQTIGDKCFYFCASLPSVTLPEGLLTIGEEAFYGCVQLTELELPATVKSIGKMGVGYSVNPDTKENMVIENFELKTIAGSKASSYARENKIAHSADFNSYSLRHYAVYIILGVIALVLAAVLVYVLIIRKKQAERALAKEREAAQAAKREARRARRARK